MRAALLAVGLAVIARRPDLALTVTIGLGAAVAGQVAYLVHATRRALHS